MSSGLILNAIWTAWTCIMYIMYHEVENVS